MISMTGFAADEWSFEAKKYRVYLKSVNHRFFDFRFKAPRSFSPLELSCRKIAKNILQRGSVECLVEDITLSNADAAEKNSDALKGVFKKINSLQQMAKKESPDLCTSDSLQTLLRFPELWQNDEASSSLDTERIEQSFTALCESLLSVRKNEGQSIAKELQSIRERLEGLSIKIRSKQELLRTEWAESLRQKIERLSKDLGEKPVAEDRLAQEFLMLAEKRDVDEELQRIEMHIGEFSKLIRATPKNLGKRMEFVAQELHREWTTLGNKTHHQEISQLIIDAKLEIEKIREQALNLL